MGEARLRGSYEERAAEGTAKRLRVEEATREKKLQKEKLDRERYEAMSPKEKAKYSRNRLLIQALLGSVTWQE